jgi:hypothetical protein
MNLVHRGSWSLRKTQGSSVVTVAAAGRSTSSAVSPKQSFDCHNGSHRIMHGEEEAGQIVQIRFRQP